MPRSTDSCPTGNGIVEIGRSESGTSNIKDFRVRIDGATERFVTTDGTRLSNAALVVLSGLRSSCPDAAFIGSDLLGNPRILDANLEQLTSSWTSGATEAFGDLNSAGMFDVAPVKIGSLRMLAWQ